MRIAGARLPVRLFLGMSIGLGVLLSGGALAQATLTPEQATEIRMAAHAAIEQVNTQTFASVEEQNEALEDALAMVIVCHMDEYGAEYEFQINPVVIQAARQAGLGGAVIGGVMGKATNWTILRSSAPARDC